MASNMTARILVAAVGIPAAFGIVWLGGWPLTALVALIALLGAGEFCGLATRGGVAPLRAGAMVLAAAVPLAVHLAVLGGPVGTGWMSANWPQLGAAVLVALLAATLATRPIDRRPLTAIAVTLLAVAYTACLPAFLIGIRHGAWPERSLGGTALVFFPLVVTWVTDSAAMFGGRAIGGAKLAPTVSPGKTRSGGLAGLAGGTLVGLLFATLVFEPLGIALTTGQALLMALALAAVGQVGDLVESLLKREAGVKDSGTLIPGHGGILDRFDSLYFVLPVAAACYRLAGLA